MYWAIILAATCFLNLTILPRIAAQDFDVGTSVQPSPAIRLTGILEKTPNPPDSAFPVLQVWIAGEQEIFRVTRVEPIIPAYPAEEELRKVSGLGLRLLAEREALTALQSPEMHNRPITIEGSLRVSDGILRVQSVRVAEEQSSGP
jgi:hypothetical protein